MILYYVIAERKSKRDRILSIFKTHSGPLFKMLRCLHCRFTPFRDLKVLGFASKTGFEGDFQAEGQLMLSAVDLLPISSLTSREKHGERIFSDL